MNFGSKDCSIRRTAQPVFLQGFCNWGRFSRQPASLTAVFNGYILKNSPSFVLSADRSRSQGDLNATQWTSSQRCDVAVFAAILTFAVAGCSEPTQKTESGSSQGTKANAATKAPATVAGTESHADGFNLKRIIILENDNSPFWDAARAGLQDAETDSSSNRHGLRATLGSQRRNAQRTARETAAVRQPIRHRRSRRFGPRRRQRCRVEECASSRKKGVQVVTIDSDVESRQVSRLPFRVYRDR